MRDLEYAAIFHEQGLGKTKIAMDLMLYWLAKDVVDTVFVVTKKILVPNWFDEFRRHSYVTPSILATSRRHNSILLNSAVLVYLMNYEVIVANDSLLQGFLKTCRVGVVLDESQKIKNPEARVTICLHKMASGFARRLIMSGTPVANRPYDIWSQIAFLDGGRALGASFEAFRQAVDIPRSSSEVQVFRERVGGIMTKLAHLAVRETKKSAGIELPDKTILTHRVDLAPVQWSIYSAYRDELRYELFRQGELIVDDADDLLKRLLRLVQCASNPLLVDDTYCELPGKYSALVALLRGIDLRSTKAIIWTSFVGNVEWIAQRLRRLGAVTIHGRIPMHDRVESIRMFKSDQRCRVLVATPAAAKEGLTLTVATHAIFYDRGFSLDDYLQAQDRIHRISQTQRCVVHNLVAADTIDEWVEALLNVKFQAAQAAQGDISNYDGDSSVFAELSTKLTRILADGSADPESTVAHHDTLRRSRLR